MNLVELLSHDGELCVCGKKHFALVKKVIVGKGSINQILDVVDGYGAKSVFVISDLNTEKVAGEKVKHILKNGGVIVNSYVFPTKDPIAPNEEAVGSAIMHYDSSDMIITVGSGVLNDIGKFVAKTSGKPYCVVGTAPSMDGYASGSSSMEVNGHKSTIHTKCPEVVIGDTEILKTAPEEMLRAGVGDIIAKYISICEWRISNIINGEYYCDKIAKMMNEAVAEVVASASKLMSRDEEAVGKVMNALILAGMAMNYAGITRPASGIEHYFSHIWDMRGLAFGDKVYFHGIQCGVGTVETLKFYEYISTLTPNMEKGVNYAKTFDEQKHNERMLEFIGEGAKSMIALNEKERKYDIEKHVKRLGVIIDKWAEIKKIIDKLPSSESIEKLLKDIGAPATAENLGKTKKETALTLNYSKDIRDKYVASRLMWDLGVLDEAIEKFYGVRI